MRLNMYGYIAGACVILAASQASSAVKMEKAGNDYVMSNNYMSVKISPEKGGVVTAFRSLTAECSLNQDRQLSITDQFYAQKQAGGKTSIEIENTAKRPFKVIKESSDKNEVSLTLSIKGENEPFAGLELIKKYTLKDEASALYVDYVMKNSGKSSCAAGFWTKTFFRAQYELPEKNIFYTPAVEGLKKIVQPGQKCTPQGDWSIAPPASWHAVTASDGAGVAALFDKRHISAFYDWYRDNGFDSTFEWFTREQEIPAGGEFSTSIVFMTLKGMETITDVMPGPLAAGIAEDGSVYICSAFAGDFILRSGEEKKTVSLIPGVASKVKFSKPPAKLQVTDKTNKSFEIANGAFFDKSVVAYSGKPCMIPVLYSMQPGHENIEEQNLAVSSGTSSENENKDFEDVTFPHALCDGFYEMALDCKTQNSENISVYRLGSDGNPEFAVPVPFKYKDYGDYGKVIFKAKGIGTYAYSMKVVDGRYSRENKDFGPAEERYRIYFNRPPEKKAEVSGIPEEGNLISYGAFENVDAKTNWPVGMPEYFIQVSKKGGYTLLSGDTPYGRNCIKIVKPQNNEYGAISFHCAVQGGKNYYFAYAEKYETLQEAWTVASAYWYDCSGKYISHENFNQSKKSFDWKPFSKVIKSPDNADFLIMNVQMYSADGYVLLKNVTIRPQVYTGNPLEAERKRIKQATYHPLDIFEQLNDSHVTPHVKWLLPSAAPAPSVFFLVAQHHTVSDTRKREIVEILQRMSVSNFHYIPLLRQMLTPSNGDLGMNYGDTYSDKLEAYTLMSIEKAEPAKYDMTLVYQLDFKGKQPELTNSLMNILKNGKGLLFLDCQNIPGELKGNAVETFPGLLLMPEMRKLPVSVLKSICYLGKVGDGRVAVVNKNDFNSTQNLRNYPCVPQEYAQIMYHDYYGRSFPYWEYMYIPLIKAIEWTAGKSSQASFTGFSADTAKNTMSFTIKSDSDFNARLKTVFSSVWKEKGPEGIKDVSLRKGENVVSIPIPPESAGGTNVVDYQLLEAKDDKIYDFGAGRVDVPELCRIKEISFSNADLCYKNDETVKLKVELENAPEGADVQCQVEDADYRIVWRKNEKAASSVDFSFNIQPPRTVLYRIFVKVTRDGKILTRNMKEISLPFGYRDMLDLDAYVWGVRPQTYMRWRELGFDSAACAFRDSYSTDGLFAALANVNLRPHTTSSGEILNKTVDVYWGDIKSDPVRNPCFSDMERWGKVRDIIHATMNKGKYRFYGVKEHFLGDEAFIGSSVCYSEHCLAGFRKYLQERYSSLDNLNREWNTGFKKWEEALPIQKEEIDIKNKNNMARWLDHKMFMSRMFALNWVGFTKKYINEIMPDSKVGLSGTQNPGYSYDWSQMMKVIDYMAYYAGIQVDLIHSFGMPELAAGQWCGGYVPSHLLKEEYERCWPWVGMFMGNNAYFFFHGSGGTCLYGDLSASKNLQIASEEVRELKNGTAKMLLCAESENTQIAVLYSQASMFASMQTVGKLFWENSLLSWKTLLNDLKYNFCFVSEEEFEKNGVSNDKFKVLVLPAAFCLSEKQTENIRKFVSAGGVVIADFGTGYFDGSGKRVADKKLDEIFGVNRSDSILEISSCEEHIKAAPEFGIGACSMRLWFGEKNFKTAGGTALATSSVPDTPLMVYNKFGKGGAFLFNTPVNWYKNVTLGGTGGELSQASQGPGILSEKIRNITDAILQYSGLKPLGRITVDGKVFPCTTVFKKDGGIKYMGLINESTERSNIDPAAAVSAVITLPFKSHVYSVRDGRYLGNTDKIQSRIIPAVAQLYAFLPYQVTGIDLSGGDTYSPGQIVDLKAEIKVSSGAPGPHVIRVELKSPSGKIESVYSRNIYLPAGKGNISFQFAFNDRPGKWLLTVKDTASSFKAEKQIILK